MMSRRVVVGVGALGSVGGDGSFKTALEDT